MSEQSYGALEAVMKRTQTYRTAFRVMSVISCALLVTTVVSVGAAAYLATHRPEPRYFATTTNGQILPLVALDKPHLNANEVANFATQAVTAALTYSFTNYRADLTAVQKYFTQPAGWNSFIDALDKSGQLEMVKERRLNTTAVAQDAVILSQGPNARGVYQWVVQIPLRITYESASEVSGQDLLVTVTINRMETYQTPEAVAINRFIAARGGA